MQSQGVVSAGSRRGMRSRQCSAGSENKARTAITNPSAPHKPDLRPSLKVACNSPTPDFTNPQKRCNCNARASTRERLPWELHATLGSNHALWPHADSMQLAPQETPHATERSNAPVREHYTSSGALHQFGSITPVPSWCNTHLSGVTPLRNKRGRGGVERIQPYREDSTQSEGVEPYRPDITPHHNKLECGSART